MAGAAPGGGYRPLSIETTTGMRMDRFTRPLLARHGVRGIIGKGGLSEESLAAFRELAKAFRSSAAVNEALRSLLRMSEATRRLTSSPGVRATSARR